MKKLLTLLAVVAFCTSAHALSFTWASSTAIKFDGANLKSNTDVTGYLVYLGTSETYDTSYTLDASSTPSSLSGDVGTLVANSTSGTSGMSKISEKFSFDYGVYDNNDVFGMVLSYVKDGTTYLNLSSTTYTLSGIADERSSLSNANFAFSFDSAGEKNSITPGSGWTVAVPEPSTAMLALAGLALLIKRRKA